MLQLKEIVEGEEFKRIKEAHGDMEGYMQATRKEGFVDPCFLSPRREEIYETLRRYSLREILGGGTGSDFMSYMIPTKIYQVLIDAFREENILPQISGITINDIQGGTIQVLWGLYAKLKPRWGSTYGGYAIETEEVDRVSISPKEFGMDMAISRSFLEDQQFDLMQYHVAAAGKEMADFAVARALEAFYAGRDTGNNVAGSTNAITVANIGSAAAFVEGQGGAPDTCVLTRAQARDLINDTTTFNLSIPFKEAASKGQIMPGLQGIQTYLPRAVAPTNVLYSSDDSDYYALVFEKKRGMAVAWKRPITIDNYTSPREGLVGAVASARVNFGVLHNGDFISAILEGD